MRSLRKGVQRVPPPVFLLYYASGMHVRLTSHQFSHFQCTLCIEEGGTLIAWRVEIDLRRYNQVVRLPVGALLLYSEISSISRKEYRVANLI